MEGWILMKYKGLILIVAGIVFVLAGIAIYGYVGLGNTGFTPAEFNTRYDQFQLLQLDNTGYLAGNSAFLNFFIRYRLVFAIAAAVAMIGGAIVCILPGKKKKEVQKEEK
jgi:hypothetical protein